MRVMSNGIAVATASALAFLLTAPLPAVAQSSVPAIAGQVSSEREGPLEGVVVSAKKAGSTITVSVVSNSKGEYRFPASRLQPGRHDISIKASGYDLDAATTVDIAPGKAAVANLKLKPTHDLAAQLTTGEWMMSAPGTRQLDTDAVKRIMLSCTDCHSVQRIFQSNHSAADFLKVFERMGGYYPGASDMQPQRLVGAHRRPPVAGANAQGLADYLASVNLSGRDKNPFELKTYSRPKGRATNVVTTEYDLPRKAIQPHDVITDPDGMVWFSHFGEQFLSKLDPATGKVTEYTIPVRKPGYPMGTLDLEIDQEGYLWIGLMYQSGMARFDRKTGKFTLFPIPAEWQTEATQQSHFSVAGMHIDGRVWVKNSDKSQIMRLDPANGKYENLGSFVNPANNRPLGIYGIYADQQNNAYILEFPAGGIGKIDAKTGKLTFYPTPTPTAKARRGRVDTQNRLWFAEYGANSIGMFDPITEKITEWKMPLPWESPYDVVADKYGEVWEVNEASDRIGRLDPKTGEVTNYMLPRGGNIRRAWVDDRTRPVTVWVGSNLGAAIVQIEPLD